MKKITNLIMVLTMIFVLSSCDLLGDQVGGVNNAPVINGEANVTFSLNADEPDWKTLITATDDEDGAIRITDEMVDANVDFSKAGMYEVRFYVPDSNGKTTMFTMTVEVVDDRVITFTLNGDSDVTIEVHSDFLDPGVLALDLDGQETTYLVDGSVDTTVVGTYTLSYSMEGVETPLTRTVHVVDTTAPVIEVDTVGLLFGLYTERDWLVYVDSVTDNYSTEIELEVVESTVNFDVEGTYQVTVKATDEFGNEATATFSVELREVVILINGDSVIQHEVNTPYIDLGATAIDGDLNNLQVSTTIDFDVNTLGTFTVIYTVDGFDDLTLSRTVEVVDTQAPEVEYNDQVIMLTDDTIDWSTRYSSLLDNYDTDMTFNVIEDNVVYGTTGEYEVTLEVADSSNNKTTITFKVTVVNEGRIDILLWTGSGIYYEDIGNMSLETDDFLNQTEAAVYAAAKEYNKLYPSIKINVLALEGGPNDGGRIWSMALQQYEEEFGFHPSLWTTPDLTKDISNGLVADLSRYENEAVYQSLNPALMHMMNIDGFQGGLPYYAIPWGIYVNKELAEEQNLDVPNFDWTIDEYTEFIRNSEENVFYGSMDSPIRIIETGTNTITKQLFNYNGTGDFVDLNSDEVRSLIPYLQEWNEYSVWGGSQDSEFMSEHWWWSYKFFIENKLLTLEGDPWMISDCANPNPDWWGRCKSSNWDIYPRPSTDFVDNTVGIVLDPLAVYNYCLEDNNTACTSMEEAKITMAYDFATFWLADTRSWQARADQEFNNIENDTNSSALITSLPITTGDLFDEQMAIWLSVPNHERYSDATLMPGFQEVVRIYKEGLFWDISDKAYPYFYTENGSRREALFEWKNYWNPEINGGVVNGDSNFVDVILSKLDLWNNNANERFAEAYSSVTTKIDQFYTDSGVIIDPPDSIIITFDGIEDELVVYEGDMVNLLSEVTASGDDGNDYTDYITVSSENCEILESGYVYTEEAMSCIIVFTVIVDGNIAKSYSSLIILPSLLDVGENPLLVKGWTFDDQSDLDGWSIYSAGSGSVVMTIEEGAMKLDTTSGGQRWETRIDYQGIPLEEGEIYRLSFRMKSDVDGKKVHINYGELLSSDPWFNAFKIENVDVITLSTEWQLFEFTFLMEQANENGGPLFEMGDMDGSIGINATMWIDDIKIEGGTIEYNDASDITILDELPTEQIDLTFWHVYGQNKEALLLEYITEFEQLYPNITINASPQGGYDDLRNKIILSIAMGETPDLVVGYTDHFMAYQSASSLIPLDGFVNHETWGVDLSDFIQSYIDENTQYPNGTLYSMPFSKSTEILVYNKTKFEANGITVPTDGSITWAMLDLWADTMVGTGSNQCEYLINYDSSANLFINSARQWQAGYTNNDGNLLINSQNTLSMLDYIASRFEDKTFAIPLAWNQSYGSANFLAQDVCMTVGSTAGINYNIPYDGSFEVGIVPIPQYDMEHPSAIQQGPNIAIMSNTTDAERLAAWLFIEFLTNTKNSASWSQLTGYLPVRQSSYESVEYQEFLNLSDENNSNYYNAQAALAGLQMIDIFDYEKAFNGPISSYNVRMEIGVAMDSIFSGVAVQDAIQELYDQLNVDINVVVDPDDGGPALLLPIDGIVYENIDLPTGVLGSSITWESSHPEYVSVTGNITRPVYGVGNQTVILTATFVYNDIEYTRNFYIVVGENVYIPKYETVAAIYESNFDDPVSFEGTVVALFDGGYFLSDGVDAIGVYNPGSSLELTIGDKVFVSGKYSVYNTLYQINSVSEERITEIGNGTQILTPTVLTIEELLNLDSSNKFIHGRMYTITGLVIRQGSYDNVYLKDGDFEVLIYYYSLPNSIEALKLNEGNVVTIDVIYYTNHGTNGVMVAFQGDSEEIIVNE